MSAAFQAIKDVNSILTLAAFVMACLLYGFIRWLKHRETLTKAGLATKNEVELKRIAHQYGVDPQKLDASGIRALLSQQISSKTHLRMIFLIGFIVFCLVVGVVAIASFFIKPNRGEVVRLGGSLQAIVEGVNADPNGVALSLRGSIGDIWIQEVSGETTNLAIKKLCDANPCLSCEPRDVIHAATVTISAGGAPVVPFTDKFGARHRQCG